MPNPTPASPMLLVTLFGLCLSLAACGKKDEPTPAQQVGEGIKDALDLRSHEKLKDAAEDAADALEELGEAAQETVEDAGEAVEEGVEDVKDAMSN